MILFSKDYGYYPNAIIDTNTKNESFLKLAMLYRDMGIKNNAFHLTLMNPELQGIDPFSETLTDEERMKIAAEVKCNPWYFLREVAMAPPRGGSEPSSIRGNRSNISLFWLFLNHCQTFLIQPRQTGKSLNTDILMVWLLCYRCINTKINLITKDDQLRRDNIQRIKDVMSELPWYLQVRNKKDNNNSEGITIKARGNEYNTHLPQATQKRARNLGRGMTTAIFHVDESPFCVNIDLSIPSAFAAMGAAIDEAKKRGSPYGTIFTTTAGKKDDKSGAYIYSLLQEAAVLDERKFYDCEDEEELETVIRKMSKPSNPAKNPNGVYRVNATFSHTQLGYSDEWLRQKLEESLASGDDANRDYFNIWTSGSERSPFPPEVSEAIALSEKEYLYMEFSDVNRFITNWWLPENEIDSYLENNPAIFGLDPSEAIGKDDIAFYMIDAKTGKTLATGLYNDVNIITIAKHISFLMVKYPKIVGIIEAKSTGVAILDLLLLELPLHGFNPFKRLFNRIVHEYDHSDNKRNVYDEVMRYGSNSQIITKYKSSFGFSTAGSGIYSRDSLYGQTLKMALSKCQRHLYDKTLIRQLLHLVIKNQRIDHEDGEHDDMVIAWLLCWWLIINGRNLSSYNLNSRVILSDIDVGKKKKETLEEVLTRMEQDQIREDMLDLYEALETEDDEIISYKLEQQLRHLNSKLIRRPNETYSIDNLINDVREAKKKRNKYSY
jgi:hypothetical protein